MNVLDLFSGIGGFSLGLERAGMRTVAFCETEPYCRAVIARHWPGVPIFGDIRELTAEAVAYSQRIRNAGREWNRTESRGKADDSQCRRESIDVICGGFPCQDISVAGKGAGLTGARSGLWSEYLRLIGELRPRYVIVENVSALLSRGLGTILGELASIGYDAEWHCIPAAYVGAPHRRDRIWIMAYPDSGRQLQPQGGECHERRWFSDGGQDVADSGESIGGRHSRTRWWRGSSSDAAQKRGREDGETNGQWFVEPDVGRVAHGVPSRVDRLRALGNAVVPQVVEVIGRAIMNAVNGEVSNG